MKLSEELQQLHDCGDAGRMVEGFAERARLLEGRIHQELYMNACEKGAGHNEAQRFANKQLRKMTEP